MVTVSILSQAEAVYWKAPGDIRVGRYSLVTCIRSKFFLNILSYTHDITIPSTDSECKSRVRFTVAFTVFK